METFAWSGDLADEDRIAPFLKQADGPFHPPVCWWVEPDLDGRADLLVTRQLARTDPMRVRPGDVVIFDGEQFSLSRGGRSA